MLANFVAEFNGFPKEVPIAPKERPWQVYVDGSSCWTGKGVRVHIITGASEEHNYAIKLAFKVSNNEAEYETLLVRLATARALGAMEVELGQTPK